VYVLEGGGEHAYLCFDAVSSLTSLQWLDGACHPLPSFAESFNVLDVCVIVVLCCCRQGKPCNVAVAAEVRELADWAKAECGTIDIWCDEHPSGVTKNTF
jgi:hypothetical protein